MLENVIDAAPADPTVVANIGNIAPVSDRACWFDEVIAASKDGMILGDVAYD